MYLLSSIELEVTTCFHQFYESRIYKIFRPFFWVFLWGKSFQLRSKYTRKSQYNCQSVQRSSSEHVFMNFRNTNLQIFSIIKISRNFITLSLLQSVQLSTPNSLKILYQSRTFPLRFAGGHLEFVTQAFGVSMPISLNYG